MANYAKISSKTLRHLYRFSFVAIASHWAFQSIFYMDQTERLFKVILDISVTFIFHQVLRSFIEETRLSLIIAFLIAHSINFLLNGHLWGVLKHYDYVQTPREEFSDYTEALINRIENEPAFQQAIIYGGISRSEWSPSSDLDVRIVRHTGIRNAMRGCWFILCERSRALLVKFPLDIYLLDSHDSLAKMHSESNEGLSTEMLNL